LPFPCNAEVNKFHAEVLPLAVRHEGRAYRGERFQASGIRLDQCSFLQDGFPKGKKTIGEMQAFFGVTCQNAFAQVGQEKFLLRLFYLLVILHFALQNLPPNLVESLQS
jgi:hypothetical protein